MMEIHTKLKSYIQIFTYLCCMSYSLAAKDDAYDNVVHKDSVLMDDAANRKQNNSLLSDQGTATYNADDNC